MCGFLGVMSLNNSHAIALSAETILNTLRTRGPDSSSNIDQIIGPIRLQYYHARLAIVDIDSGPQPMIAFGIILIFNGEIYNYKQLRLKLIRLGYIFRTETDTEVVCAAIREWGEEAFSKFDGIFAIQCYDKIYNFSLIARDPLGVKPLYFYKRVGSIFFSSDCRVIAKHLNLEVSYQNVIEETLLFGYIGGLRTPYKDINKVSPGTYTKITHNSNDFICCVNKFTFIKMDNDPSNIISSILMQVPSEVPWGVQISGGVDSSAILAALESNNKIGKNYFINFKSKIKDNEISNIKIISKYHNVEIINLTEEIYFDFLHDSIKCLHSPLIDSAIVPMALLASTARKDNIKVLFSGVGGDELFMGYSRYHSKHRKIRRIFEKLFSFNIYGFIPEVIRSHSILANRISSAYVDMKFSALGSQNRNIGNIKRWSLSEYVKKPGTYNLLHDDPYSNADFNEYLANCLLPQTDQVLMGYGIEGRVPLISPSVVNQYRSYCPQDSNKLILKKIILNSNLSKLSFHNKDGFGAMPEIYISNATNFMIQSTRSLMSKYFEDKWLIELIQNGSVNDIFALYSIFKWFESN